MKENKKKLGRGKKIKATGCHLLAFFFCKGERDVDLNKSSSVSALWGFGKTRSFLLEISVAQVRLVLGVGCCLELDEKEHTVFFFFFACFLTF